MLNGLRRRVTYANVMSTIAVFAVLGGGAWAAQKIGPSQIKNNAVRAKHVKKNQVRAKHIRQNQVRTRQIKNGAVTRAKLSSDASPRWAVVNNSGFVLRGRGAVDAEAIDTAVYEVTFNRDVSECAWSATVANPGVQEPASGEIGVRPPADNPNGVVVHTWNDSGNSSINRFNLVVNC